MCSRISKNNKNTCILIIIAVVSIGLFTFKDVYPVRAAIDEIREYRITPIGGMEANLYENKLVFNDVRNGNSEIYLADISNPDNISETRITNNPFWDGTPSIYENIVVWRNENGGIADIYMADISDLNNIIPIKINQVGSVVDYPGIYGNVVVWQDGRNGNSDIYMAYISDPANIIETQITSNIAEQSTPSIYGNKVVWTDLRNDVGENGFSDIYLADISDPSNITEIQITTHGLINVFPKIHNNTIVWFDNYSDIYMADVSNLADIDVFRLTNNGGSKFGLSIYGNRIVWQDTRNDITELYLADIIDSKNIIETKISNYGDNNCNLEAPVIYGNNLAWSDYRNNDIECGITDIYYGLIIESEPAQEVDVSQSQEIPEKAEIDSWRAYLAKGNSKCGQKLKLDLKGNHFDKNAKVKIDGKSASSVDRKSSKKITATFCMDDLLKIKIERKRKILVKNPDTEDEEAEKRIDLSAVSYEYNPSDLNVKTLAGVKNIQEAFVRLGLLDERYVTGFYGSKTREAVEAFQARNGLPETGFFGSLTKAKLTGNQWMK